MYDIAYRINNMVDIVRKTPIMVEIQTSYLTKINRDTFSTFWLINSTLIRELNSSLEINVSSLSSLNVVRLQMILNLYHISSEVIISFS